MTDTRRIRITFAASTLNVGGSENVVASLIERLDRDRFDCDLVTLKQPGVIGDRLFAGGVSGIHGLQEHGRDPRALARLVSYLRLRRPHILFGLDHHNVITWGSLAGVVARVAVRVIGSHTTGRLNGKPSFSGVDRFWIRSSTSVIALSDSHAQYLSSVEGVARDKIAVIENGIDVVRYGRSDPARMDALRAELDLADAHPVIIHVAAMRPEKAHDVALSAARALRDRYPALRLLLAGDGPERPRLERLAEELELSDVVHFLGVRSDVADILHLCDALVLPSHPAVETLPLAVMEAMAAGVPVVASRVGSVPDMIEDRVSGRLIESGDVIGLAGAIGDIIDNNQETVQMIQSAKRTLFDRFTIERMITRYEAHFEGLVRY